MKSIINILFITGVVMFVSSCSSSRTVQRMDPSTQTDLSGRWNDTDSRLVAEELTTQLMGEKWIHEFELRHKRKPVIIVGLVRNKSHEHIDAETFIKDIERSGIKRGTVRWVQAGEKREELRVERADQQEFASAATAKKWGLELGADYMLQGSINSLVDQYKKEKTVTYQIDLELTHLETNEIVWVGDKKIKKMVTN